MGNIQRRPNGKYRARYRDPSGRERARHFDRKAEAQRWLRDELHAHDHGRWVDPHDGQISVLDYYKNWSVRQVWTGGTSAAMWLAIKTTPFLHSPIGSVRRSDFEEWIKAMATGSPDRPGGLAASTIRTRFTNVRSVFRAAQRDGLISIDPSDGVRLPRQRRREASMAIPTPDEVRAVLRAAPADFRAYIAVCAFAGLRLGEAAALLPEDIDFERRELHVRRQVQRTAGGGIEVRMPKYNSERTVPVPELLLQLLREHLALPRRANWLFSRSEPDPPHQNTVGYRWRSALSQAKVRSIRLHDLRHFYASGLIAAGCDVVTVQRALGHAKASTTLETYSHLWPSADGRTRAAAAALVAETLGESADSLRTGTQKIASDLPIYTLKRNSTTSPSCMT